jgi:hypothetical protein
MTSIIFKKFLKAQNLLNEHPALNPAGSDSFFSGNLTWWVNQMCENNEIRDNYVISKNPLIWIDENDKRFDLFFDEFHVDHDDDHLYVPYRKIYGYNWIYDHCEYVGEYCMFKYCPELNVKGSKFDKKYPSIQCYNPYQGGGGHGATFEEMVIDIAADVVKKFGPYSFDEFLTTDEDINHENNSPFNRIPVIDEKFGECMSLEANDKYITVPECELNLRWWDWYRTTKHYAKSWEGE